MKVRDLFQQDVTRDIAPVVYFHEQTQEKLLKEVSEYIITGGYPAGDPRARRYNRGNTSSASTDGIHEQFVRLLEGISREMDKKGGPELPASWISGFYGSGKSSFAKLLGLSLDSVILPNQKPLAEALLAQDDSPRRQEFVQAWQKLTGHRQTMAVVFDIGGVAREGEDIHSAVLRQLQLRLGYCSKSNLVAEHELRLERDGEWPRFLECAQKTLKKSWQVAKEDEQADDHFSHVLHVMHPDRYTDPMSWIDSRAGARTGAGTSAHEVVKRIEEMLDARAPGKMLFIVVDEVSQYIHENADRMLRLQTFVSALGQTLKGAVWLLATGQQKLEEAATSNNLGKLKDRFPSSLRVHLGSTNIRDVIHKRLLKKKPEMEPLLRELFQRHRSELKLYGYRCEELTEEDFVEVYPMLPEQIDLLMKITTSLRTHSKRIQGDDHAIRGLLQLLGELFREQQLADAPVGRLVTIDAMYDVQHTALDPDVQTTLERIFAHPEVREDSQAKRVAKAIALLSLIHEEMPANTALITQCLYGSLTDGNIEPVIQAALNKLQVLSLISYSEKSGYRIQSSAGQEWLNERDNYPVTHEAILSRVQEALKVAVGSSQERARWRGRTFPWALYFSDGRQAMDVKLQEPRDESTVTVDFRWVRREEATHTHWVPKSGQDTLRNRVLWVAEDGGTLSEIAREYERSVNMVKRYEGKAPSLSVAKNTLFLEERGRAEDLARTLERTVQETFFHGDAYFRGQALEPQKLGNSFVSALNALALWALPNLYPQFTEVSVDDKELRQLLDPSLAGASRKFFAESPSNKDALGILEEDAKKIVCTCTGIIPSRITDELQRNGGMSGAAMLSLFIGPPFGYPADVVKACCAGLLRAKKIRIRPESGEQVSSYADPGAKDVFFKLGDFRRAEFFPATEGQLTQRDRVAIARFFSKSLGVEVDPEDELLADTTFERFPSKRSTLRELESRFQELPGRPALPAPLQAFGKALEDCCRSRRMESTVLELKRHLDVLRDGFEQLALLSAELTPTALGALKTAHNCDQYQSTQLRAFGQLGEAESAADAIKTHLQLPRPWRDAANLSAPVATVLARYTEVRTQLLNQQHTELESARARVKLRPGYATLAQELALKVLRPLSELLVDTSAEATAPTLAELRDRFTGKITGAEELANELLDAALSAQSEHQVVKVDVKVRGREVASREQLKALFAEIEERVGAHLDRGARVRIV